MSVASREAGMPVTGEKWAAKSEAYAALISQHLSPETVWLDAGCGLRLLEDDLDPLENWLAAHCGIVVGMDVYVTSHRNIKTLVRGSLYSLPFADCSLDLVTCNMVIEHLDRPAAAFVEIARCLRLGGAFIVNTPNLLNYGVFGNAVASRVLPEAWRLQLLRGTDDREASDFFKVRYKANTMRRLAKLLDASGLQVHKAIPVRQSGAFFRKTKNLERLLMKLTPISGLLVGAHKRASS